MVLNDGTNSTSDADGHAPAAYADAFSYDLANNRTAEQVNVTPPRLDGGNTVAGGNTVKYTHDGDDQLQTEAETKYLEHSKGEHSKGTPNFSAVDIDPGECPLFLAVPFSSPHFSSPAVAPRVVRPLDKPGDLAELFDSRTLLDGDRPARFGGHAMMQPRKPEGRKRDLLSGALPSQRPRPLQVVADQPADPDADHRPGEPEHVGGEQHRNCRHHCQHRPADSQGPFCPVRHAGMVGPAGTIG